MPAGEILTFVDYAIGPAAALFLALLLLAAIVKFRWLVPWYVLEGAEKRIVKLDDEADTLNESLMTMTEQNGEMKASMARLEERESHQTGEIVKLRAEVETLRSQARRG